MLSKECIHALRVLSAHLTPSGIVWYLTGKANLALQGLNKTKEIIDRYLCEAK